MKPNFALSLSFDGIRLLHRVASGWHLAGEVALDAADLDGQLATLRRTALALDPSGLRTKLLIPNEQIRYLALDTAHATEADIEAALDGATPYEVHELVHDHVRGGGRTYVAAVARETLFEAEEFASEHRFAPVAFAAVPLPHTFIGEAFFGPTRAAARLVPPGRSVERDEVAVTVIGQAHLPRPTGGSSAAQDAPVAGAAPDVAAGAALGAAPDAAPDAAPGGSQGEVAMGPDGAGTAQGAGHDSAEQAADDRAAQPIAETTPDAARDVTSDATAEGTAGAQGEGTADGATTEPAAAGQAAPAAAPPAPAADAAAARPAEGDVDAPVATHPPEPATAAPDALAEPATPARAQVAAAREGAGPALRSQPAAAGSVAFGTFPSAPAVPGALREPPAAAWRTAALDTSDAPPAEATDRQPAATADASPAATREARPAATGGARPAATHSSVQGAPAEGATRFAPRGGNPSHDLPGDSAPRPEGEVPGRRAGTLPAADRRPAEPPQPDLAMAASVAATLAPYDDRGQDGPVPGERAGRAPGPEGVTLSAPLAATLNARARHDERPLRGAASASSTMPEGLFAVPPSAGEGQAAARRLAADERLAQLKAADRSRPRAAPRLLALVLTAILLIALAGVAAWAALWTEEGLAGLFGRDRPAVHVAAETVPTPPAATPPAATTPSAAAPGPIAVASSPAAAPPASATPSAAAPGPIAVATPPAAAGSALPLPADAAPPDAEDTADVTAMETQAESEPAATPEAAALAAAVDLVAAAIATPAGAQDSAPPGAAGAVPPATAPDAPAPETAEAALLPDSTRPASGSVAEGAPPAAASPRPDLPRGIVLSPAEAERLHAATGVWQRAPRLPLLPRSDSLEGLRLTAVETTAARPLATLLAEGDGARPDLPGLVSPDARPLPQADPPPPGAVFDRDAAGFVRATEDGAATPEGAVVFAGAPPVRPPARPATDSAPATSTDGAEAQATPPGGAAAEEPAEAAAQEDAAADAPAATAGAVTLASLRPATRPASIAPPAGAGAAAEEAAPIDPALQPRPELAGSRPQARPGTAAARADDAALAPAIDAALAEATAPILENPTQRAVPESLRPDARPLDFATAVVEASGRTAPATEVTRPAQAASLAVTSRPAPQPAPAPAAPAPEPAPPQIAAPSGPIPGGVATAATQERAINLRDINLIGVYGRPGARRALIRLGNGRYVKVGVGDSLDGGQVSAIGDNAINYVKRGRTIALAIPSG